MYEPSLPAYSKSFFSEYNSSNDFIPWKCQDEDNYSSFPDDGDFQDVIIIEGEGGFQGDDH